LGKMAWGVIEGDGTGWAMQLPAIVGLAICNGFVLYAHRKVRSRTAQAEVTVNGGRTVRP